MTVIGAREVDQQLAVLIAEAQGDVMRGLDDGARELSARIVREAPSRTGRLRSAVRTAKNGAVVVVGVDEKIAPYARYVERGTGARHGLMAMNLGGQVAIRRRARAIPGTRFFAVAVEHGDDSALNVAVARAAKEIGPR